MRNISTGGVGLKILETSLPRVVQVFQIGGTSAGTG
jgi:hypothetical protein